MKSSVVAMCYPCFIEGTGNIWPRKEVFENLVLNRVISHYHVSSFTRYSLYLSLKARLERGFEEKIKSFPLGS